MEMPTASDPRIQTFRGDYDYFIPDNILFPEYMLKRIASLGNKVACVDAEKKTHLTFNEINTKSYALASGLQAKFNLKPGDSVGIALPNCLEYPIALFAATLCGASVALFNPAQTFDEMKHSTRLVEPNLWIATHDFLAKFQRLYSQGSKQPPVLLIDTHTSATTTIDDVIQCGKTYQRPNVNPTDHAALVLFSSGTTGVPKGVVLTHFNLVAARRQTEEMAKCARRQVPPPTQTTGNDPCIVAVLPFYHTFGLTIALDSLLGGMRFVVMRQFTLHKFLQAIQEFKVSIISVVPAIAIQLAKQPVEQTYDLTSLRFIRCGASAISLDIINQLKKKFNCVVYQGYGMTEVTVRSHSNFAGYNKDGSVGGVIPFCQCKVVDRDTNQILGPNQEGEICVKGPALMKGYIGDAVATNATIDSEGWLHTGDVGFYDTEGFFFLTDRMKELIKYKGLQVSPTELEKILITHPDVLDVAVAPIADPSAGEVPRAYVVKRPGSSVSSDELATYLSDKVSSYKRLRGGVIFIQAVPKTSTGKIIRRALKDQPVVSKL